MAGPASRAVSCPLCNEKFFPASLPFHQKQCAKNRAVRRVNCPYCQVEVSQLELPDHIKNCPKCKGSSAGSKGRGNGGGGGGGNEGSRAMPAGQFDPEVTEDGRMRCIYCGRYFNSERIDKHQAICGNLKNARPKGVDGQPTQTCRKVFNAEAQRLGQGACFMAAEKFEQKQAQKEKEVKKLQQKSSNASTWRRQHEEFVAACRAGRGDPNAPPPASFTQHHNDGKIPCPHCGRRFDSNAADRHIPICANVMNKPKPVSSAGRTSTSFGRGVSSPGTSPAPSRNRLESRSADGSPAGSSTNAVKALRRNSSASSPSQLPQKADRLEVRDGSSPSTAASTSATMRTSPAASPKRRPSKPGAASPGVSPRSTQQSFGGTMDNNATMLNRTAGGTQRLGLRRSAMLYRLLSQVPAESLAKELVDLGLDPQAHDQEGMIEVIIEQLS